MLQVSLDLEHGETSTKDVSHRTSAAETGCATRAFASGHGRQRCFTLLVDGQRWAGGVGRGEGGGGEGKEGMPVARRGCSASVGKGAGIGQPA